MTITKEARIAEALQVLTELEMPKGQLNDRTAISLLALLDLDINTKWENARNPMLTIRGILDFARNQLDTNYVENSRESVRKYSVKQMVDAGILLHNPDDPKRAVNSSKNCYQVEDHALNLFRKFETRYWSTSLKHYKETRESLAAHFAQERDLHRIPLQINSKEKITLSPGAHSELIRAIVEEFGSIFVKGGELIYIGETGTKWAFFDQALLNLLNVYVDDHGKMPDVVIYQREKNWIILAEAVTSAGPVDRTRYDELSELFKTAIADLVFVTAFSDRGSKFRSFLDQVAWETEVWCASDPTHLIHFNGEKFLGPYKQS